MIWQDIDGAPRDGEVILVCRNNDVSWEWRIVFWSTKWDKEYPWKEYCHDFDNAYPEDRFDYWAELTEPYRIKD